MSRRGRILLLGTAAAALLALVIGASWRLAGRAVEEPAEWTAMKRLPRIRPDYSGIVVPPNIAPLNFLVEEPGLEYRVRIRAANGADILLTSLGPSIVIPPLPWRELLEKNRGGRIELVIYVKSEDAGWRRFNAIENTVALENIDSHLVYRLLGPLANLYRKMGIYQRNLETYDESPVLANDSIGGGCVNCHSFANNSPDCFSLHVRPGPRNRPEAGMVVVRDGGAVRAGTRTRSAPKLPGFSAWHPGGSAVAFSMNQPGLFFREAGCEVRDVFDLQSDLALVNLQTGAVSAPTPASGSPAAGPGRLESFPAWSADGKTLYFCAADRSWGQDRLRAADDLKKVKYDLMRVPYDIEKDKWGAAEPVLTAADTGMSITEPRASPDGRYLLFCMSAYGGFPVYQPSSDLYLLDLRSGKHRRLECNSNASESWHCWSSNSRWIVFSSKRDNGWLARPYFSYIDAEGHEHKPFLLPQKDPAFYDTWLKTYNLPELITGPITTPQEELLRAVNSGNAAVDESTGSPAATQGNEGLYQQ
jgi:hypothetical protein